MKKEGFTLIELLAVIVILAVIAVIATPIIVGIIDDARISSNERTVENYLSAVEMSIVKENMKEGFNPSLCIVEESNALTCDSGSIMIQANGKEIQSGYIEFNNGKVENYSLTVDGVDYETTTPTNIECFTYEDNLDENSQIDGTITITDFTCDWNQDEYKELIIPKIINGKIVTKIGERAFANHLFTKVVIPNSVKIIEDYAIMSNYPNSLSQLIIPNSVIEVKSGGFMYSCPSVLILPNSIKIIDTMSFRSSAILKKVILGNSLVGTGETIIGANAFEDNSNLSELIIGNSVNEISGAAFINCSLEKVVIGNNVETIGSQAFLNNEISDLTLGNNIVEIGYYAFLNNKLTSVVIPDSVETIGSQAFLNNQITDVVIGSGIQQLGNASFMNNSLTKVTFKGRNNLSGITIGSGVWGWETGHNESNSVFYEN